jgi:hypothetical protein
MDKTTFPQVTFAVDSVVTSRKLLPTEKAPSWFAKSFRLVGKPKP